MQVQYRFMPLASELNQLVSREKSWHGQCENQKFKIGKPCRRNARGNLRV